MVDISQPLVAALNLTASSAGSRVRAFTRCPLGDDHNVMDVGVRKAVRTAAVFEGDG
jgi:hypothetical protein